MIAAVFAGVLALQEPPPGEDPTDLFAWARRLDDLDLSWTWGDFDFEATGALTLEAFLFDDETSGISLEQAPLRQEKSGFPTDTAYKRTRVEDGPEVGGRFQLFLDGFYQDWLAWFVEARADHGAPFRDNAAVGARLEQYWLRVMVPDQPALNFQAGKFSAPIGNFLPRHAPRENPLATFPLPYDQVTTFMYKLDTAAVVLGRRDLPDVKDWRVPIWQEVYGTGAMAFGKVGGLSYAAAVMNSAPGTWAFDWDYHSGDFKDPNVYLRAGYAFGPGAKLGATWSRGPYDREDSHGIPSGRDTGDFPQTLFGVDLEYSREDLDVFAEVYWTRFETPLIDDLELWSWYAEAKYTFLPGLFGAVRLAQMFFGEIEDAAGESRPWDRNVSRVEFGGGYFFTRNFFVKATGQLNYTSGGREPNDHMLMLQVGLTF